VLDKEQEPTIEFAWPGPRTTLALGAQGVSMGTTFYAANETLGERESGTERLLEAVKAYRDALKEFTRERVPFDWATTQNNLGIALAMLGERES
jgi:hypothetical protein